MNIDHINITDEMKELSSAIRDDLTSFTVTGKPEYYISAIDRLTEMNALIFAAVLTTN